MFFDPVYFVFLAPAMILAMWAQGRLANTYARMRRVPVLSGLTGAQAAEHILSSSGLRGVRVEPIRGTLSDHYDPRQKVLRLSPEVYNGRSIASVGIAAHEAGHALQDAQGYAPLAIRNGIVPLANIGGGLFFTLIFLGFILGSVGLVWAGILLYSAIVVLQLVNLPVEYDASARARQVLLATGIVDSREEASVRKVLSAAALTYVAATLSAIMTLLYLVLRVGGIGGSRD